MSALFNLGKQCHTYFPPNMSSTCHPEVVGHTAADLGNHLARPEEVAAGHTDPAAGIDREVAHRTDPEVGRHIGLVLEAGTGLAVGHRIVLEAVRRIDLAVAAVRKLAEVRHRTDLRARHSRQVQDGWSSRLWNRSCDQ